MKVTVRYDEVKFTAKRNLRCRECGKRMTRQQTFYQTINPFNKNLYGEIKTYSEIRKELKEEASFWEPEDICQKCEEI